jgi:hypothetical protein
MLAGVLAYAELTPGIDAWIKDTAQGAMTLPSLTGVFAYAELTPGIEDWVKAGSLGEMTLPSITGIGMGWWVLAFLAFLAFAGWGMSRLEQRFAHLKPRT